jgi:hypothetical protein
VAVPLRQKALASWAVLGVLAFIGSAVRRLLPVALEPVLKGDLTRGQAAGCALWVAVMVYVEGYKSFHLKFSPLVVKRSFVMAEQPTVLNTVLAGPYAMGLIGASKKRAIVSWSIVAGVMVLVKLVKLLDYPWYVNCYNCDHLWSNLCCVYALKARNRGRWCCGRSLRRHVIHSRITVASFGF